jgi:hypothetical protein
MSEFQGRELNRLFAEKLKDDHHKQRPDADGNMKIRHTDLRKCFTLLLDQQDEIDDLSSKLMRAEASTKHGP